MNQPKILDGIMSLDEANDVIGAGHHKEARNGVFKGNAPEMHFTAIRGNKTVQNTTLPITNCRLEGTSIRIPNCTLEGQSVLYTGCVLDGTAVWTPQCDLDGNVVLRLCDLSGTSTYIGNNAPNWTNQGYSTCLSGSCLSFEVQRDTNQFSATYQNYRAGSPSYGYVYYGSTSPTPGLCNSMQNLQPTGESRCYQCTNQIELRDVNPCSPTYTERTWVSGGSSCNYEQTWVVVFGSFTCVGNNKHYVEQQTNPCATAYGTTRAGGVAEYNSCYCIPGNPILTYWNYSVCWDCVSYPVYRNTNSCSPTYGNYYVGGEDQGPTAPAASSCNYDPVWTPTGYTTCIGCSNVTVYRNTNICSSTYQHYQVNGSDVGTTEPSRAACNTSPNFVNDGSNTICQGYNLHQRTIDNNPCSASFGNNGVGALIQANSASCGYTTATFNTFVSLVDAASVCTGGEYGVVSCQVIGTNMCDALQIISLPSSVWGDMLANEEFYIHQRIGGVFKYRKFRRDGSANTAVPIEACGNC